MSKLLPLDLFIRQALLYPLDSPFLPPENKVVLDYSYAAGRKTGSYALTGEVIEANFETGGDAFGNLGDVGGGDYWIAPRFVTSGNILYSSAEIYIEGKNGVPTGDITFRIETDSENKPSGVLAHANATRTIANSKITLAAWNKCFFIPFTLPAGTYWLVVHIPDQANDVYWKWTRDLNGIGYVSFSTNHGVDWTTYTNQFMPYFRIYKIY